MDAIEGVVEEEINMRNPRIKGFIIKGEVFEDI
jgi:hypothetical protein